LSSPAGAVVGHSAVVAVQEDSAQAQGYLLLLEPIMRLPLAQEALVPLLEEMPTGQAAQALFFLP